MPPFKLAIIGAGPSAFYVASRLLLPSRSSGLSHPRPDLKFLRVHMYDRLWAPHGLVRYGVAPDHPEVKNCMHKFDEIATDPRFRFFGNVNIGEPPEHPISHALQIPLSALLPHYSHLLFATGCTVPILHPSIPPSQHCIPALSIVHWYTRHPSRPPAPPLNRLEHITIIGHGNVSLDVARILLSSPTELAKFDIPQPVLETLSQSTVKHISIIGRRGPFEVSFTTKELREMMNLKEAFMTPIDPSILIPPVDASLTRQQARILQLLQKGSSNSPASTKKSWSLDFFRSPISLAPPTPSSPSLSTLMLAHTTLDPTTNRAIATGATSTLSTPLVVTSLGFKSEANNAFYDPGLKHLRTVANRVTTPTGTILQNMYASGWSATGAKGVLASTTINANDVANTILSDVFSGTVSNRDGEAESVMMLNPDPPPEDTPPEIRDGIAAGLITDYADWKKVDAEEIRRGEAMGKERERMSWEDAIAFLKRK